MAFATDYIKFYPVLLVWPIWFFTMTTRNLWYSVFSTYWPATIGMVLGSFIAGSTPLGGGVVAFPIAVLVLQLKGSESRDASVLIQSVGMNAAAFLLITTKSQLLNGPIIYTNIAFGTIGMLLGLSFNESPELTNLIYTVTVLCFGIVYFYTNVIDQKRTAVATDPPPEMDEDASDTEGWSRRDYLAYGLMAVFAIVGGFITASVGSGSDIAVFVYGIYVWNVIYPENKFADNTFTASSVVVMGAMSALIAVTRAVSEEGFDERGLLCWAAMIFVVVWGAPIGSLVLTPSNTKYLQYMFYMLAVVQFILFAVLKIGRDLWVWIGIVIMISVIIGLLALHYSMQKRKGNAIIQHKSEPIGTGQGTSMSEMSDPSKTNVTV